MGKIVLKLYVTGGQSAVEQAADDLQKYCEQSTGLPCDVEIVDAMRWPQKVVGARVLAFPTIIREAPLPLRRVIGDISNPTKILAALDLLPTLD
ncbi:circadian clock KaiB family protein [Desulfovibrio inopinatus]|uniref:circadian clock KaiB family protein n=1 Tax=Desulfovibrio inopinatus TaxID=102109 RepID=UPI0005520C5B|nr:circadian clock KaiB family protein [Desulfovibrio inopinatus]